MTDVVASPAVVPRARRSVGVRQVFRAEWRKLTAQLVTRVLALVCAVGPVAAVFVLKNQSGLPTDSLLGVWAHSSGFAVVVVLLVFCATWGFPVIAGLAAGDSFASEDRLGTWKTVLTRSGTRRDVFLGKVLAVALLSELLVALLAVSTVLSALLLVGHQPMVGVDGSLLAPKHALLVVGASWLWSMLPVLAFTCLAVLFSVATANGIVGVLGPILVGLVMQLLALIGGSEWTHLLLVGSAFEGWHTFLSQHPHLGPLLSSGLVCAGWIAATLTAAWLLLRRRDFAGTTTAARTDWPRVLVRVGAAIAVVILVAAATRLGPTGVTATRLQSAIGPTFGRLTIYQQRLLGRNVPWDADIRVLPACFRRGQAKQGPGDDWTCSLDVFTLGSTGRSLQNNVVHYDVSVHTDGCYRAEGPPTFVGRSTLRAPHGRQVVNPLFIFYGCFDTL